VRFLYVQVLERSSFEVAVTVPKRPQRIPELLTRAEVARIVAGCMNLKHRALLLTCYGCGLRVSERVALQVADIDAERHLLRVRQGKGAKDRLVLMGERLLEGLREYWRAYRPRPWLFNGAQPEEAMRVDTAQRVFTRAKARAEVERIGGIHSLRHAYATHQLEAGLPVHVLQRLLGAGRSTPRCATCTGCRITAMAACGTPI